MKLSNEIVDVLYIVNFLRTKLWLNNMGLMSHQFFAFWNFILEHLKPNYLLAHMVQDPPSTEWIVLII